MLKEYDVVRLKSALADAPVPVGAKGTVLIVYLQPREAYEVEFISKLGKSFGTSTVGKEQIEKWQDSTVFSEGMS